MTPRELPFFGPQKYVRTTGSKDVYVATINVPSWMAAPFRMHVQNGEADGTFRVSSATIDVNGTVVLSQSDFNQNAASFDRTVTLTPSTKLTVTLASTPTSYLYITLFGTSADYTAPKLTWALPAPSSTINTATPRIRVQYSDAIGLGEPAAAGVDLDTLKVSIDDIDRTSLFTRRSDEASAQIPTTLPAGRNTYKASISDLAGNRSDISGEFRVDLNPPTISVFEPAAASYLATRTPTLRIRYTDETALSLQSLRVTLNGNDATAFFNKTDAEAVIAWPAGMLLPEGPNQLSAKIQDLGGNEATTTVAFNVDVKPPQLVIAQPVAGGRLGSHDLGVTITYSDDQAIIASSAIATIDGNAVNLTRTNTQATAQLTALADSTHTLVARVSDRAGNVTTATSAFTVDTSVPKIEVVEPPAGAKLKTNTPGVRIDYSDEQGVDVNSFKVSINSIDRTNLFVKSNASAAATITGFALPEGVNEIAAEIRDVTANLGKTISSFLVDTAAPTGSVDAPADRVTTSTPTVTAHYADSGSGIDPATVHLFVDAADRSSLITATTDVATGVLTPPLADGAHEVKFTFGDQAGNLTTISKSFVIDTHPPQLAVVVPANDSFINATTPALRITYSDPQGTGINLQAFRLTLQKGNDPEKDIASWVTTGVLEAIGMVPDASKLADGTYHLRAQIADVAGNVSTSEASFEIDTVAPTYQVESPAANGYVASTTPQFTIRYDDELSGVDTGRAVVLIDGVDKTARFTFADGVATGRLLATEPLAQGRHTVDATFYDRAGNRAPSAPQTFTVDTIVPTAAVEAPLMNSYVGKPPYNFAVTYADVNGSGVDPASVKVTIDGVDRTADFTAGTARATATITAPLADSPHALVVSVLDWAGNAATATSSFIVDSIDPVVKITAPAADVWLKGPTIAVSGNVTDASPTSVEVNGLIASLTTGAFTTTIPAADGSFTIHAVARDAAGNAGTADVKVNVDSAAPVITISEPAANLVTNKSSVHLAGTASDASAITMTLNGQPLPLTSNAFATDVQLSSEGANAFTLVATDAAGNSSTSIVRITRDTVAPVITVASPIKSSVIGTVPIVVRGTLVDASAVTITVDGVAATITSDAWQASIAGLAEGPHTFAVVATDGAANTTTVSHDITIDLNAPIVTITTPASGALTKDASTAITGTATDVSLISVKAAGIDATLAAGSTANEKQFTIAGVPLSEGDNTLHVIATDAIARTTDKSVLVTRDSTAPVISVAGPDQVTRSRTARLIATATDNLTVRDVVFKLGTTELARLTATPYQYDFSAPLTAVVGDTLSVTITATDTAGNTASVTKSIRFVAEGALTGQVLSDVDGRPVHGAQVVLSGAASQDTLTDDRGRYAFPVNDQNVVLSIDSSINGAPTTTVERVVAIQSGVGTVPVDARLTLLGPRVLVGSAGAPLTTGNVVVSVPSGAVSTATGMRLTLLSPQGLPNLLPLGWSPVAAFNVLVEGTLAAPLPFNATVTVPAPIAHLVFYKTATHAWTMTQAGVTASAGAMHVALPEPGTYALVISDDNAVPVAAAGEVLKGVAMQPVPDLATSSGQVTPPTLPPSGGSAVGKLVVKSPTPLPSGTVVQAEITETFSLSSGETASEEKRTEDLVLYRNGADLVASFPIVPSRTFSANDLVEGTVHLDILAGREAVRGQTGGGNQAVSLTAGIVNLTVPAGALPNDVAIAATPTILSSFLPSSPAASPFAEVVLDFSGFTLASAAQLSASAATLSASDTVVIARVERINGVPKVVVVAAADRNGNRVVSREMTGFAGIRTGGRYVFYRIGVPWSTISGTIGLSFGSSTALVQVDGLPFVALANTQGQFSGIAPVGTAHVTAFVPGTSLTGSTTVAVVSGQTAIVSFGLTPTRTTATITPANGAIRVPVSVQIEITASAPLNRGTANVLTLQLRKSNGDLVPASYVFASSGRVLAIVPTTSLVAGETYTVTVNGLTDIYGGVVTIAPVTFTTQPDTPPNYDTNKIVFTMPDSNGMVTVSAPAGSLPPGTRVLIVNSGNGVVVSYTVVNDGSFSGTFPASISDRLLITITDPKGNVVNFEKSKYVATDGSGRVAIGPAGGTVEGPGGVGLIVPDGALTSGAVFKVEPFGPGAYSERPDLPTAHFGSGLKITSEQMASLKQEGKLVFPKPADAPEGSFYYVYKRVTGPNGRVDFEVIDEAFPDGKGSIVTASYPFIGWNDSVDSWDAAANTQSVGFGLGTQVVMYMMWTWDAMLPGLAKPGAIAGKALRPVWKPGATEPDYEPVSGAMVRRMSENGKTTAMTFAISQEDGTFSIMDPQYTGGTVDIEAVKGTEKVTATAFEANPVDSRTFAIRLFQHWHNVASTNVTFAAEKPAEVQDVDVVLMTLETATGQRQLANGMVTAGTPLVIGFRLKGQNMYVTGELNEKPMTAKGDPYTGALKVDYILQDENSRNGATFEPGQLGTYTVTALAHPLLGGAPIPVSYNFVVIGNGGGNFETHEGTPPTVLAEQFTPEKGKNDVPVDTFVQIVFSEPVKQVPSNVNITGPDGVVPVVISGISFDAQKRPVVISDLAATPGAAVTGVTLRALRGLRFGTAYTVTLSAGILDLDTPTPHPLIAYSSKFTTYQPSIFDRKDAFAAVGAATIHDSVYVAAAGSPHGQLLHYRYDHESLSRVSADDMYLPGSPSHIAAQALSPATSTPLVVVTTSLSYLNGPSNLVAYDTSSPPRRRAAVSLTESFEEGVALRVALKGRYAYAYTFPKGICVVDMVRAAIDYDIAFADPSKRLAMNRDLVTAGQGFAQDSVVMTVPVRTAVGLLGHVSALQAFDTMIDNTGQTLVFASGSIPLFIGNPQTGEAVFRDTSLTSGEGSITWSYGVAVSTIGGRSVAVLAGPGTGRTPENPASAPQSGSVLVVVDVSNPRLPSIIGSVRLSTASTDTPTDVKLQGNVAFVGFADRAMTVNLTDPTKPALLGTIAQSGGRLTVSDSGGVFSVSTSTGYGVHVTSLQPPQFAFTITEVTADVVQGANLGAVQPRPDDYMYYSVPRPGEKNRFERTFNLTLGGRPPGSEITRVKVTLWASPTTGVDHELQTVLDVPGFDNRNVRHDSEHPNDDRLIVSVTHHDTASNIQPPPMTHNIFYRFEVTANFGGVERTTVRDSEGRRALWRMPDNLFTRFPRRDPGGDDWASRGTYEWMVANHNLLTAINDISGEHAGCLGHATHIQGVDLDIFHFVTLVDGGTGGAQYNRLLALIDQAADGDNAALTTVTNFVRATRTGIGNLMANTTVSQVLYQDRNTYTLLRRGQVTIQRHGRNVPVDTGLGEWNLSRDRLQPDSGHRDHIHVRLHPTGEDVWAGHRGPCRAGGGDPRLPRP